MLLATGCSTKSEKTTQPEEDPNWEVPEWEADKMARVWCTWLHSTLHIGFRPYAIGYLNSQSNCQTTFVETGNILIEQTDFVLTKSVCSVIQVRK